MPIPIAELEQARRSPEERILEFLGAPEQRGKAFKAWEILMAVDGVSAGVAALSIAVFGAIEAAGTKPNLPTFQALLKLAKDGDTVATQTYQGEEYYYLRPEAQR